MKYPMFEPLHSIYAVTLAAAALALTSCGGGGGGAAGTAPVAMATASVVTPATGKTAWNLAAAAQFSLRDGNGVAVLGALACSSDAPTALVVAADCTSIIGKRLGLQTVTVSGGGLSAKATLKVIPQAQPLASHGPSGQFNMVVTPTGGRVLAWGANTGGVLGQGKTAAELVSVALPTAVKDSAGVADLGGIVAVSAGTGSALALTEDGEVWSWGDNGHDQLGRVAINGATLPGKVVSATGSGLLQRIVAVSVGDSNAVALADDGTVYSWGGYSGQSGVARAQFPNFVSSVASTPGSVTPLTDVVAVSAGWNWTAALLADGRIVSWGYGNDGRQGQGSAAFGGGTAPTGYVMSLAQGLPLTGVVSLSAGYNFGLALNDAGQVYAWGDNSYGQAGQNSANTVPVASAVLVTAASGAGTLSDITMVAAGGNHALAQDSTGLVYSWGYSQNGQLGDGANHPRVNASPLPAAVVSAAGTGQLGATRVIAAGYADSLALAADGSLLIWGSGYRSNLGQGGVASADAYVPLPVKNEAGTAALSLAPLDVWPNLLQRGR